jgi:uncharacterized damage-inducible protein DinB
MSRQEIDHLLYLLDEAYSQAAWHGPNLHSSIRGLSLEQAAWRPQPGRHNIREIVVHAAYWKSIVRRRLLGEKRGAFPLPGSNWFKRPLDGDKKSWRRDVDLLQAEHQRLRAAIAAYPPEKLNLPAKGSKSTALRLIVGAALHDVYHAGQIQLLKRLWIARKRD